ncbi:MAG: diguanylate cyclase, partial [Eggerthellaceae bacterium]|nr:diguanylate cyclase [Eggerthellaceae bacterium]
MADAQRVPKRSIYSTLVIPMIALVVSEVFLFSGILFGSGVLQRLDQNDRDILVQQVITRRDSLQSYLVGTVGDLRGVANVLNAEAQRQLDEGTIDFDLLDSDPVESNELVNVAMEPLISTIRDKRVSGAFIVFNTHDLSPLSSTGEFGKKPGVHIHDMDPAATPSARNEDLVLECASTEIVQSFRIATGTDWLPTFNFQKLQPPLSHDAFYLPWQTAYESSDPKEATDFAYWGVVPFSEHGGEQCAMSYSIPLILEDGTVYGVVGVELSADYLEDLLPSSELLRDVGASYVLAIVDDSLQGGDEGSLVNALPVVQSSRQPVEGVSFGTAMELAPLSGNDYTYKSDKGDYYSGCQFLRLYNTNSPFEHQHWLLVGMVSESVPHSFGNHVRDLIVFASLLMAVLGIAGSILAARSISRPIRGLSADVASAQLKNAEMPKLEETGISEVDQLTGAITSLSKDIASVRQLEQQRIEHERDYDLLTGLMNRRALYREANRLFASPADVKHAALVMLDLDDLKTLNDTYGHDWGDKYIYQAARCFEDAVPSTAMVVRVSGDEFFILLYGYESREEIENVLNQMREGIASHAVLLPNGDEMPLRASGGVAFYPDDAVEFTELTK